VKKQTTKMSSDGSFTVFLPSNVNTQEFVNTRSDFTVPLADPIELDGGWEVALREAFIPNYWQNFYPPFNQSIVVSCMKNRKDIKPFLEHNRRHMGMSIDQRRKRRSEEDGAGEAEEPSPAETIPYARPLRQTQQVPLPAGWYTPPSFCAAFNKLVENMKWRGDNRFQGIVTYDEASKRLSFTLKPGELVRVKKKRMRKMLGLDIGQFAKSRQDAMAPTRVVTSVVANSASYSGVIYTLPHPAHFNANMNHMYIYTDMVEFSRVGDIYAPIICVLNLDSSESHKEVLHVVYDTPQYFNVKGNSLKSIQIQLKDSLDEFIQFERGVVLLVYHFRKRVPRNIFTHI
jgi:hypothetical protein